MRPSCNCTRLLILQKFGGTYQDFDVLWSSRVPDWLLTYPAVVCPDWVPHESWPETFNQGVMMARRRSAYLQHMLESFKANYNDKDWFYNGVMMPNKVLEMHPDTVFVYRHLQVNIKGFRPEWYISTICHCRDIPF